MRVNSHFRDYNIHTMSNMYVFNRDNGELYHWFDIDEGISIEPPRALLTLLKLRGII